VDQIVSHSISTVSMRLPPTKLPTLRNRDFVRPETIVRAFVFDRAAAIFATILIDYRDALVLRSRSLLAETHSEIVARS
jgi:hypothetical protein